MLVAEEAATRLASLAAPDWEAERARRIASLDQASRRVLEDIVGLSIHRRNVDAYERGTALFVALSDRKRRRLLTALHPGLAEPLLRWWSWSIDQPLITGAGRRAFRVPHHPELTASLRFTSVISIARRLEHHPERTIDWVADWAAHLDTGGFGFGSLLASAIDAGDTTGDRVFDSLVRQATGDHPIGHMGDHVVRGLLQADRPEGWRLIEQTLLAAQRQEGLRQSIFEVMDEAHPRAFDQLLGCMVEHDLLRFAAAIRTVGVWLGLPDDTTNSRVVARHLDRLIAFRSDIDLAKRAIEASDAAADIYLALMATAMRDSSDAVEGASRRFEQTVADGERSVPIRRAIIHFLATLRVPLDSDVVTSAIEDEDTAVAVRAATLVTPSWWQPWQSVEARPELIEPLRRLAARLPKQDERFGPYVHEHVTMPARAPSVLAIAIRLADADDLARFVPDLPLMDAPTRRQFVTVAGDRRLDGTLRAAVIGLAGDPSSDVRNAVVDAIIEDGLRRDEAPGLERLLTRKATTTRKPLIRLLSTLEPDELVESIRRLWTTGNRHQRDAACELIGSVNGLGDRAAKLASDFVDEATDHQLELLGTAASVDARTPFDDFMADVEPPPRPRPTGPGEDPEVCTDAALRLIEHLDDLAERHRNTEVTVRNWQGSSDMLLADVRRLPRAGDVRVGIEPVSMLLEHEVRSWIDQRPDDSHDDDGLEVLRGLFLIDMWNSMGATWFVRASMYSSTTMAELMRRLVPETPAASMRHPAVVAHWLSFLCDASPDASRTRETGLSLAVCEYLAASVPDEAIENLPDETGDYTHQPGRRDFRGSLIETPFWRFAVRAFLSGDDIDPDQARRFWKLWQWVELPRPEARRNHVSVEVVLAAFRRGLATRDQLVDALMNGPALLSEVTRRRPRLLTDADAELTDLGCRLADALVATEAGRGDLPTPASNAVRWVGRTAGVDRLMTLIGALGSLSFSRGYQWDDDKKGALSRLIRICEPAEGEGVTEFSAAVERTKLTEKRLIELAVYAPQWAELVEQHLEWSGLVDGVWWIHAHTKDTQWSVGHEQLEGWKAQAAERTALDGQDLIDGGVDVDWFHRQHVALGGDRWKKLYAAGKNASSSGGHRRAQLFADAILGRIDEETLLHRIHEKRNKDAVRALGLLPLPTEDRPATMLRRYLALQDFERTSRKFGAQRRESEKLATRIAVDNLARAAGFADPQQFCWMMEADAVADLAEGPVVATADDVTVKLEICDDGTPALTIDRAGKRLKSVPAKLRKHDEVGALRHRHQDLKKQVSRIRRSLEDAMVRGDLFTADAIDRLRRHPMVTAMLGRLLFVDDQRGDVLRLGDGGAVDHAGTTISVEGELRLAHPADLLAAGRWEEWQRWLIVDEISQPFKQVYRELYVPTEAELGGEPWSTRYEGHQLQPGQARALFGSRGWFGDHEGADVSRMFHSEQIAAHVEFLDGFLTPAEVEPRTVSRITFTRRGRPTLLPLDGVPPRVFSEAMRDLDLVVSVAHAGQVDPEASSSTIEMRRALATETLTTLGRQNVTFTGSHALIEGALGEYSVHLGSGVVHRRPGGSVCIVPVHAQRRGRLFLPFADDDPKTAEVLSIILLFSDDASIKDPTVLAQLR
ncbi:MAG: DUF5724 domain-containing protein [Actinomycetota bacterium]